MQNDVLETRLLGELARIEREIHDLQTEKASIERLLISVRRRSPTLPKVDVTRKNSINRALVESVIAEMLRPREIPTKTFEILTQIRQIHPAYKETTLRSILHRMKSRGLVKNPREGRWEIIL